MFSELDSFVLKFKQLWKAGVEAHLAVDSHAGQAWLHLHVPLGQAPGPNHEVQKLKNKNNPSRQRRRVRREAVRIAEAVTVTKEPMAEEAIFSSDSTECVYDTEKDQNTKTVEIISKDIAGEVIAEINDSDVNNIECCYCDLVCKTESVLEAHWRESHSDEYQFPDSDTENLDTEDSEN